MSDELKPCPFCGCNEPMVMEHTSLDWVIHCKKCHAKTGRHHTFQGAIYAWNARSEPEELPEWVKDAIADRISQEYRIGIMGYKHAVRQLEWVLSLRKPEAHS